MFHPFEFWTETATGTNAGATATKAASTGTPAREHFVDQISGFTDADSLIQIKNQAGTVLWEIKIVVTTNGQGFAINIPGGVHSGTGGQSISGVIASSTAACRVNISGHTVP